MLHAALIDDDKDELPTYLLPTYQQPTGLNLAGHDMKWNEKLISTFCVFAPKEKKVCQATLHYLFRGFLCHNVAIERRYQYSILSFSIILRRTGRICLDFCTCDL